MTNEDLQQIQAIVHTAVAPLATQIAAVDAKLEKTEYNLHSEIQATEHNLRREIAAVDAKLEKTEHNLRSEIQASEKRIAKRVDDLETLAAHYQDREIRRLTRRIAHVEEHLHITP